MSVIMPPKPGEDVDILASAARLRGHVTGRADGGLTIELEQSPTRLPFRLTAGSQVELEWVHPLGVMQVTAKVDDARQEPRPTLEVELVGEPEPVERRVHERARVRLDASAWTLQQPTRRLTGHVVDLTAGGAQLRLPDLALLAATLELTIALPEKPLHVSGRIVWRREPDLVGVQFQRLSPEAQARLVEFLHAP
jgi:hypothetical protein